jgi:hypothetical protein
LPELIIAIAPAADLGRGVAYLDRLFAAPA